MSLYKNINVVISANSRGLTTGLRAAAGQVDSFGRSVHASNQRLTAGKAAMAGVAAGAVAVAAGLAYSVDKAVEFDSSMRNVNSLMHLAPAGFKALEDQVVAMSRTLPQSAKTLADGLYDITSSGFAGADAMTILKASAESASAGLTTTDVSSRAITATLNAYGLKAKDAADVSDTLFQTVNLGVVSFEELAGNIGDVVGGAAAAKVSIDQVGSAIATMTLAGISGAEATTSLNRLLQKIIQPSDALAAQFKSLGYESGASALKTKGLHGVMEDLRKSSGGNIETLLKWLPEIRAARGALALMANDGKNYNKVASEIENKNKRAGSTARTLAEQMKSAKNEMQMLKNQVDASAISLGTKLLPALIGTTKFLGEAGTKIGQVGRDIGSQLGPTWEALGQALHDVGKFAMEAGVLVAPLAGALAKLAVGTVVGTLNLLAGGLAKITGLMSGHTTLVLAVAAAYGVNLLGALIAAQGGLKVMAWRAFGAALSGILTGADTAAAALARLRLAQIGAAGAGGLLVAAGLTAWSNYNAGAKQAEDATKAVNSAMKSTDFSVIKKGADDANASLKQMSDFIVQQGDKASAAFDLTGGSIRAFQALLDFSGNAKAFGMSRHIEDLEHAADLATGKVASMRSNTMKYLMDTSKLQGGALDKWITPILSNTKLLDGEVGKLAERAAKAGVDLSGPYDVVKAKLDAYAASTTGTAAVQGQLISAMGKLGSSATDSAEAVDSLKGALDELLGTAMSADAASDKWLEGLDKLTAGLKKNGSTIDNTTAKGRANKQLIRDSVTDLKDRIEIEAKAGKSGKYLSDMLTSGISTLYKQADAADFSKAKMKSLLTEYNLTPELVQTIVNAVGTDKTGEEIQAILDQQKGIKDSTIVIKADGTRATAAEIKQINEQTANIRDRIFMIKATGSVEAAGEVEKINTQISHLKDKQVAIITKGGPNVKRDVAAVQKQIDALTDKKVKIYEEGAKAAKDKVAGFQRQIDALQGKKVKVLQEGAPEAKRLVAGFDKQIKELKGKRVAVQQTGAPDSKKRVAELDHQIKVLQGKRVDVLQNGAPASKARVAELDRQIKILQGKIVTVGVSGAGASEAAVASLRAQIARLQGKTVNIAVNTTKTQTTVYDTQGAHHEPGNVHQAQGGLMVERFALGGTRQKPGVLPKVATIAKDGANLVQWAEPGTGGEAFIPLNPSRRKRSTKILAQVAEIFGLKIQGVEGQMQQQAQALQGEVEQFAKGGFHYPAFKYPKKKPFSYRPYFPSKWTAPKKGKKESAADYRKRRNAAYASWSVTHSNSYKSYKYSRDKAKSAYDAKYVKDKAAAQKQWQESKDEAAEQYRENARLASTASGHAEGNAYGQGRLADSGGSLGNTEQAAEARAQATAQRKANLSRSKSDTAADFYKKPKASAKQYTADLKIQTQATKDWGGQLAKIAKVAGADVAAHLEKMGVSGKDAVSTMAHATTADMKRMADEMRKLDFAKFVTSSSADAAAATKFQGDLATLVKMGRADLASKFAAMGVEAGGSLAASAITMTNSQAATLNNNLNATEKANDPQMQQALSLAALIQKGAGKLGVQGLARQSGTGLADVLGILTSYNGTVFSKLPASVMKQIKADQALMAKGKQPSGLARGGIVRGGQQQGLYYQWAEGGAGGESLIPHRGDRARSHRLWAETGRIIGAQMGGSSPVHVSKVDKGAVVIRIDASNSGIDAGQLQAIAQRATSQALDGLAARLRAGSGRR